MNTYLKLIIILSIAFTTSCGVGRWDDDNSLDIAGASTVDNICGGEVCGDLPWYSKQCCTTDADVSARIAGSADKCGADMSALFPDMENRCLQRDLKGVDDPDCPDIDWSKIIGAYGRVEKGCCATELGEAIGINFCGSWSDFQGCHLTKGENMPGAPDGAVGLTCDGWWITDEMIP